MVGSMAGRQEKIISAVSEKPGHLYGIQLLDVH